MAGEKEEQEGEEREGSRKADSPELFLEHVKMVCDR